MPNGTSNALSDGESYTLNSDDEPTACLFSKDYLVINGTGSLTINAVYNDGITGKDDLKIAQATINITSADDGIVGKDLLAITSANITVSAKGDGLKASNDTDEYSGILYVESGTLNITSETDGLQAVSLLEIAGGDFTIVTGGGSANSSTKTDVNWGNWGGEKVERPRSSISTSKTETSTVAEETSIETEEPSAKGIKATLNINISGGAFNINSSDDSIHSNGSVYISDGIFNISSGDDGIHADSAVTIDSGLIEIVKSYEGIEASNITINAGDINLTASDDGINVAGGSDGSSTNGRMGQNSFAEFSSNTLEIKGGDILVNASGDGIDVNGTAKMTGGYVIVNGPTNNGNGALDYDGSFDVTGGTLCAFGSSGMAMSPSTTSSVLSFSMTFDETKSAGTAVSVNNSSGDEFISFTSGKEFQNVLITCPDLKIDSEYSILADGETAVTFTPTEIVTYVTKDGITTGGGNGMGGGKPAGGGMGGGRNQNDTAPSGAAPTGEAPTEEAPIGERPQGGRPSGQPPKGEGIKKIPTELNLPETTK